MSLTSKDLFSPLKMGSYTLKNRIGLAPMTRMSSEKDGIPRQDVLISWSGAPKTMSRSSPQKPSSAIMRAPRVIPARRA